MILKVCMGAHTHYFLNILRFILFSDFWTKTNFTRPSIV